MEARAGIEESGARLGPRSIAWLVLAVAVCRVLAVHSFPIYDDAFITFRYARNLAAGHGLVFNPGAEWEPVLGTTTPGYSVLLAFFARLGADIVRASIAVNIVCDCASAVLIARLLDRRALASVVAVATFAAVPQIARVSVGGMEAPLFLLLALGATTAASSSWLVLSGLLASLACTVRPEGVLIVLALAAFHVRSLKQASLFAAPVVIVGALYAGALTWYFGDPIPQSIKAKADFYGLGPRVARAGGVLAQSFGPSWPTRAVAPLALLGFVLVFAWKSAARAFVAFSLAMVVAYAISGTKTWGWYFYVPLAGWCVALGIGCDALLDFAARARPALVSWRTRAAVAVSIVSVIAVVAWSRVVVDRVTPNVYAPMRAWCESNRVAELGKTICASDIGAIGYLSNARILDSEGLVWPEGRAFEDQFDVVDGKASDYAMVVVNRARYPSFAAPRSMMVIPGPVARFSAAGVTDLNVNLEKLPDTWVQDYVMFALMYEQSF